MKSKKAMYFIPTAPTCPRKTSAQNWQKPTKWTKTKYLSSGSEPNTVEERAQGSHWFTTRMRHSRNSSPITGLWDTELRQRLRSQADSNVCTPFSIGRSLPWSWSIHSLPSSGNSGGWLLGVTLIHAGKQRKNRAKTVRGTAKTKGGVKDKAKKK